MDKIRSLDVLSIIAITLLLVTAEQANGTSVDADCIGPCTNQCDMYCKSMGYTHGECGSFRGKSGCCCKPPIHPIFEHSALLNN
ncbi:hypothetical protein EUTSA_v10027362mg [Eutrema salsugineum]|uniref:Knottin scorpion toxin-like domain-containing protein n=1 Tax=Eutrema salsugineum TaxID=72664 RepID=V4LRL8_EUTSA|nr:defensin-like protein 75 [Eutrema salsugineum]ESQ53245.1 hypothetical protein EUTSA_v10027362mg [Eutrema salsugineum]